MEKLNEAVLSVKNKVNKGLEKVSEKMRAKKNGAAGTIATLILIVIVVGLLITFKTEITGWVTTLTGRVTGALSKFDPTK